MQFTVAPYEPSGKPATPYNPCFISNPPPIEKHVRIFKQDTKNKKVIHLIHQYIGTLIQDEATFTVGGKRYISILILPPKQYASRMKHLSPLPKQITCSQKTQVARVHIFGRLFGENTVGNFSEIWEGKLLENRFVIKHGYLSWPTQLSLLL